MSVHARAWAILLVILALELIPFTITFALSRPGVLSRLYAFDAVHWSAWLFAPVVASAYIAYAARAFPLIRENFFAPPVENSLRRRKFPKRTIWRAVEGMLCSTIITGTPFRR